MSKTLRPLSRSMARELTPLEIDCVSGGLDNASPMEGVRTDWYCADNSGWHYDNTTHND